MGNVSNAIKHLVVVNVLFFIATMMYGDITYRWLSLWFIEHPNFGYWQFITYMFMHSNQMIGHIFFNMFAVWVFGGPLERIWGSQKFFFFYFSTGLGAALIHMGVNYYHFTEGLEALANAGFTNAEVLDIIKEGKYMPDWYNVVPKNTLDNFLGAFNAPTVGASGAVYGLMVAFGMTYPDSKLYIYFVLPVKTKYFVSILILLDLLSGVTGYPLFGDGGIAHFAHLGGALIGFIMMWYWKKNQFNQNRWN